MLKQQSNVPIILENRCNDEEDNIVIDDNNRANDPRETIKCAVIEEALCDD